MLGRLCFTLGKWSRSSGTMPSTGRLFLAPVASAALLATAGCSSECNPYLAGAASTLQGPIPATDAAQFEVEACDNRDCVSSSLSLDRRSSASSAVGLFPDALGCANPAPEVTVCILASDVDADDRRLSIKAVWEFHEGNAVEGVHTYALKLTDSASGETLVHVESKGRVTNERHSGCHSEPRGADMTFEL